MLLAICPVFASPAYPEMIVSTKDGRVLRLPVNNSDIVKIEYIPSGTSSLSQGFNVGSRVKVTKKDGSWYEGRLVKMHPSQDQFYVKNVLVKKSLSEFKKITATGSATYAMVTVDGKTLEAYTASILYDFEVDVDLLGPQRFSNNTSVLSVEVIE